jgi:peptidoglycan/xylan/chitin deacetylase (PgdA/CDA1 family)
MSVAGVIGRAFLLDVPPVRVPVVMLHSVAGDRFDRPPCFSVWCPPPMFEGYLAWLARRGYHTVTLRALHDHLAHGAALPRRPIVLTFDDGYLDNWVCAAPLLRRHGFTATVFVASDFVEPSENPRRTLEDAWAGRCREQDLELFGYMNRGELRRAAAEGVLDVQSHAKTHTWLPVSGDIADFHRPGLPLRHLRPLWWNRHPDRKPFWFREIREDAIPWGVPVYRDDLALARPAYRPDIALEKHVTWLVEARGGAAFFAESGWRDRLLSEVRRWREQNREHAHLETAGEFRERLEGELAQSRTTLESITGKPVEFLCWPNGGTCDEAFALLGATGYRAATLPSRARQPVNQRGNEPARIGRISSSSFFRGSARTWPWVLSFALKVERNRGNFYADVPIKAIWLYRRFVRPSGATPPGALAAPGAEDQP